MFELIGGIKINVVEHVQIFLLDQNEEVKSFSNEGFVDRNFCISTSNLDPSQNFSIVSVDNQHKISKT